MINKNGEWIIKPRYNKLDSFINGIALVGKFEYNYFWAKDSSYQTIRVDSFKGIEKDTNYKYIRDFEHPTVRGTVSKNGKEIIPIIYSELYRYVDGYALGLYINKKNSNRDSPKNYYLLDKKGTIFKKIYHDEVIPQYYMISSESYHHTNETYTSNFTYQKQPPLYQFSDYRNAVKYVGLLDSKGNDITAAYTNYNKFEQVGIVVEDPNDSYFFRDTTMIVYDYPPFYYDSLTEQFYYKLVNDKQDNSVILDNRGNIIYKSSDRDCFSSFPSNTLHDMTFERANGKYKIYFNCPIRKTYDTVGRFFDQFKWFPNLEITAFQQAAADSPYNTVTHKIFVMHRDSLFGLINKNLKVIIPLKYAKQIQNWNDEYLASDYIYYNYLEPETQFIYKTKQFIYSGNNIESGHAETFIISEKGAIISQIIDCVSATWEADSGSYELTFTNGTKKHCDINGIKR